MQYTFMIYIYDMDNQYGLYYMEKPHVNLCLLRSDNRYICLGRPLIHNPLGTLDEFDENTAKLADVRITGAAAPFESRR